MTQTDAPSNQAPSKPRPSFWSVVLRIGGRIVEPTFTLAAAGVAFYAFLAIFPTIAVVVSIYGLLIDPEVVQRQTEAVDRVLPSDVAIIINNALHGFAVKNAAELNTALAIGFLVALWSARAGTSSLMSALNVVFNREETRGIIFQQLTAIGLTLAAVFLGIFILAGTALIPVALGILLPDAPISDVILWLRWPILFVLVVVILSAVYRFAPCRPRARFRITLGALVAALLWIVGSTLFSIYIAYSKSYDAIYGSLTAVVVLLLWLWVSAYVILTGACIDAERLRPLESITPGLPFVPWDVLFGRKTEPD